MGRRLEVGGPGSQVTGEPQCREGLRWGRRTAVASVATGSFDRSCAREAMGTSGVEESTVLASTGGPGILGTTGGGTEQALTAQDKTTPDAART